MAKGSLGVVVAVVLGIAVAKSVGDDNPPATPIVVVTQPSPSPTLSAGPAATVPPPLPTASVVVVEPTTPIAPTTPPTPATIPTPPTAAPTTNPLVPDGTQIITGGGVSPSTTSG